MNSDTKRAVAVGRVAILGQWSQVAWKGMLLDDSMTPTFELGPPL